MIALLKGRIEAYEDDGVIVDVGGVGYHVTCSSRTLAALPRVGEMGQLFTEMLVSENAIRLVGFATEAERAWFRLLDNVQGVGTASPSPSCRRSAPASLPRRSPLATRR